MFSGPLCYVEKMTATSTTSPKGEPSPDLESDREIQNALDKKRKKRKSVHLSDVSVKHAKLDCKYKIHLGMNCATRSSFYHLWLMTLDIVWTEVISVSLEVSKHRTDLQTEYNDT